MQLLVFIWNTANMVLCFWLCNKDIIPSLHRFALWNLDEFSKYVATMIRPSPPIGCGGPHRNKMERKRSNVKYLSSHYAPIYTKLTLLCPLKPGWILKLYSNDDTALSGNGSPSQRIHKMERNRPNPGAESNLHLPTKSRPNGRHLQLGCRQV